jgi:hypothetical protein
MISVVRYHPRHPYPSLDYLYRYRYAFYIFFFDAVILSFRIIAVFSSGRVIILIKMLIKKRQNV